MSEEMTTIRKSDLEFVRAYNTGLEGMKVLLTRERDDARARIVELEKELSVTNDTYTDERELRGMYQARCAELEAHAATLTGLANQYKADRDSLEETCRMHSARVIELEKRLENENRGWMEATTKYDNEREQHRRTISELGAAHDIIAKLKKQLAAANDRIIRDDMACREPETIQEHADTYQPSYAEMAYEAWQNLPGTPKETKLWGMLKGHERNEWRAIVEPVVERVRAEKTGWSAVEALKRVQEKFTFDDDPTEYFRGIIDDEIKRITDTTKPTKPTKPWAMDSEDA